MRDLHNNVKYTQAIAPVAAVSDNTAWVSGILDTANASANEFVLICGTFSDSDATFTVLLEEGNVSTLSDNSAVADADMLGTEAGASPIFSDDNKVFKLGYKGTKRYIRATVTPATNTAAAYIAAAWAQWYNPAGQTTQKA